MKSGQTAALGIAALAFLVGTIIGSLFAVLGGVKADEAVTEYLTRFSMEAVNTPALSKVLADTLLYPALCVFLGYTIPGFCLIPIVIAARSFFLSYAAACSVRVFGMANGTLFTFFLTGFPLLLCLPCLMLLGANGFIRSYALWAKRKKAVSIHHKPPLFQTLISVCLLILAFLAERYLCPWLVGTITL